MTAKITSVSTEFIYQPGLVAFDPTAPDAQVDITTLTNAWAFLADNGSEPTSGDWIPGSWTSDGRPRLLIGPGSGGHVVAAGHYAVWLKITGTVEQPERKVGLLDVT